jgi:Tfp pilus assembly protein PilF
VRAIDTPQRSALLRGPAELGLVIVCVLVAIACSRTPSPKRPDPVRDELALAEEAERARDHERARAHYERAIKVATDPASAGLAHREFAETLATWGELDNARAQFERAVVAAPKDPIAWQELGIVRANQGDIPGAFAAAERAKQLAPKAFPPRRDLAVLHWRLGEGRDRHPDPAVADQHRAAALAEYRAILDEIELPDRYRDKVKWAIDVLSKPAAPPPTP